MGTKITYADGADILQKMMSVVIPFVIVIMLLKKAKDLAVKYSGDMGSAVMSVGKMVGGVGLMAATGGAAALGTRVGGGALGTGLNKWAAKREAAGKTGFMTDKLRGAGNLLQRSSFDVRGIKIGGKTLASATGMNVGKAQEGGWMKQRRNQ